MVLMNNTRMLYWREHPNSRNKLYRSSGAHDTNEKMTIDKARLSCRSERMVLSIWKHNFVCCMPETKSNLIPLA